MVKTWVPVTKTTKNEDGLDAEPCTHCGYAGTDYTFQAKENPLAVTGGGGGGKRNPRTTAALGIIGTLAFSLLVVVVFFIYEKYNNGDYKNLTPAEKLERIQQDLQSPEMQNQLKQEGVKAVGDGLFGDAPVDTPQSNIEELSIQIAMGGAAGGAREADRQTMKPKQSSKPSSTQATKPVAKRLPTPKFTIRQENKPDSNTDQAATMVDPVGEAVEPLPLPTSLFQQLTDLENSGFEIGGEDPPPASNETP